MFNQKILAEQGEVFKAPNGQIQKISNNAPSHDDDKRINKFGINRVNKGDGGVEIDADSVLSDSYRQVENGNRENNVKEQIVKIKPIEGESIAGQLGLDIRLKKAVSPSQLFLAIQKAKDKKTLLILGKSKNTTDTREGSNSNAVNASQLSTLPTDEEIYNAVFEHTEEKKESSLLDFNDTSNRQYGGNSSLLNSLNLIPKGQYSTSIQRPINPFQIQKNQRDVLEEEWNNRQTYLSPTKQKSPAVQQYYKNEQAKKEANEGINNRQNITNAVGMALAPVPVLGEIYNTANTIANGIVDVAQGEYADAAMSAIPYGLSKLPIDKLGSKYLPNAYKYNSNAIKENPNMFLYRAEPTNFDKDNTVKKMRDKIAKGEGSWIDRAYINQYELGNPDIVAKQDFHGQWMESEPERLDFYLNSGDKVDIGTPMSIWRKKFSKTDALPYSVKNNPKAQEISYSHDTEFVVPRDIIESGELFPQSSWENLIKENKMYNTPHWWKGYKKQYGGSSILSQLNLL